MSQEQPSERSCTKCGEVKPLEAFSRTKLGRYGRRAKCKECCQAELAAWRKTDAGRASAERDKARRRAYHRKWYRKNREKVKAQVKARYWADPERSREAGRERYHRRDGETYYQRNREKQLALMRARYEAKREEYIEQARRWALANPEKRREIAKRWDESSSGRLRRRRSQNIRRARKAQAPTEDIDFQVVFDRDGGICGICGKAVDPDDWHLDHVLPLAAGGPHTYDNVQVAHPRCNVQKGTRVSEGKVI